MTALQPALARSFHWPSSLHWLKRLLKHKDNAPASASMSAQVAAFLRGIRLDATSLTADTVRQIVPAYLASSPDERFGFLLQLASLASIDYDRLAIAAKNYLHDKSGNAANALIAATQSPLGTLCDMLGDDPAGLRTIIRMREDCRARSKQAPELEQLDAEFLRYLRAKFRLEILQFRQLGWNTAASLLEVLMEREAVHPFRGWTDLRRRFQRDRRCFALFHPGMPEDPLIFIEVALLSELPATIAQIIDAGDNNGYAEDADTAVFYSITNCHTGLQGIAFGEELILRSVTALKNEFPRVKTFATLSPVPGFRAWLETQAIGGDSVPPHRLAALCKEYTALRREDGTPLDSVARFHLGNGAWLGRVNCNADPSLRGSVQSHGVMVNYIYSQAQAEQSGVMPIRLRWPRN